MKAIAPRFALYDTFTDVACPGGAILTGFLEQWTDFNQHLDSHKLGELLGFPVSFILEGVTPVENQHDEREKAIDRMSLVFPKLPPPSLSLFTPFF